MSDVTITLGADVSGLVAGTREATAALGAVATAEAKVGAAATASSRKLADLRNTTEGVKKALQAVNPAFGAFGERATNAISAVSTLTPKVALLTAGLGAGVLAVGAMAAGLVSLASSAVDTAKSVDALAGTLKATTRDALAPQIVALRESRDAMAAAEVASNALAIVASAELAPAITGAADVLGGLRTIALDAALALGVGSGVGLTDALRLSAEVMGGPFATAALGTIDYLAGIGKQARTTGADLDAQRTAMQALVTEAPSGGKVYQTGGGSPLATILTMPAAPKPSGPAKAAGPDLAAEARENEFSALFDAYEKERKAAVEQEQALASIEAEGFATRSKLHKSYLAEQSVMRQQAQQTAKEQALNVVMAAGNAFIGIAGAVSEALGMLAGEDEQRRREAFEAQKAIAIAQAIVGAALAGIQAINAAAGQPILAAINLAAIGAMTAVQIATIASAEPQFHRGGMRPTLAPDEMRDRGAVVRQNEYNATLTRQGYEAMGGERGLAAMNAGQPPAMAPIFLVVDGLPRRAREFAKPTPGYGLSGGLSWAR